MLTLQYKQGMFLLKFMSTEENSYLSLVIASYIEIKHPNIKNAPCCVPQKPLPWISALASSLQLADAGTTISPLSGCNGCSIATSWHT